MEVVWRWKRKKRREEGGGGMWKQGGVAGGEDEETHLPLIFILARVAGLNKHLSAGNALAQSTKTAEERFLFCTLSRVHPSRWPPTPSPFARFLSLFLFPLLSVRSLVPSRQSPTSTFLFERVKGSSMRLHRTFATRARYTSRHRRCCCRRRRRQDSFSVALLARPAIFPLSPLLFSLSTAHTGLLCYGFL